MKRIIGRGQRGIALVWTALLLVVMVLMMGLAIDTAYVVHSAQQLQVGADAAALGAAYYVRSDPQQARDIAVQLGQLNNAVGNPIGLNPNPGNAADGDIVFGVWDPVDRTFTPSDSGANAVRVVARRSQNAAGGALPLLFGPMAGVNTVNVERSAIACHPSRDIVLVLDYSRSMNDDSRLTTTNVNRRGRPTVENNLHSSWQLLGSPTYGNMTFEPRVIGGNNTNNTIQQLGLNNVPYPYPRGSWSEFVNHVRSNNVHGYYRNRFGMITLLDYWNASRTQANETPDLWMTDVQPITAVKDAVSVFLEYIQLEEGADQVGLVSYTHTNGHANIEHPLTQSYGLIETRSRQMQAGHYQPYTNIGAGIQRGIQELDQNGRPGTLKVIVLLSDGVPNLPVNENFARLEALRQADNAAAAEYRIVTVSLGYGADANLMQEIADRTDGLHFNVPGSQTVSELEEDLLEVFSEIAGFQPIQLVQ